jgi:hypothetical protein
MKVVICRAAEKTLGQQCQDVESQGRVCVREGDCFYGGSCTSNVPCCS